MKQVRVLRPVVVRKQFETASWHQDIELKPGIYPMQLDQCNKPDLVVYVPGIVVSSAFPSSFCGNRFGDGNVDKDKGREEKWHIRYNPDSFWDKSTERHDGAVVIEDVKE